MELKDKEDIESVSKVEPSLFFRCIEIATFASYRSGWTTWLIGWLLSIDFWRWIEFCWYGLGTNDNGELCK